MPDTASGNGATNSPHRPTRGAAPGSAAAPEVGSRSVVGVRLWLAFSILGVTLYCLTADRQPQWQDSGEMQVRMLTNQLEHPHGLALIHPLQFYLGRWALQTFPTEEPAAVITLAVSAVPSGLAVGVLALLAWMITRSARAACIAAAGLLLSHTFWQHATITECYGVTVLLLTLEWLCLARYALSQRPAWLLGMALCSGLGIANHGLALLTGPANLVVTLIAARRTRRPALWFLAVFLTGVLGALPYLSLVWQEYQRTHALGATLQSALVGTFTYEAYYLRISLSEIIKRLGFFAYNFPGVLIPLALLGLRDAQTPRLLRLALLAQLACFFLFAIRYYVADAYSFFFPCYMVIAVLVAMGARHALSWRAALPRNALLTAAAVSALWPPLVYWLTASTLRQAGMLRSLVQNKPYRDGYATFFLPWGSARSYAVPLNEQLFALAAPDGLIILEDNMAEFSVRYWQLTGRGAPDVTAYVPYSLNVRVKLNLTREDQQRRLQQLVAIHRMFGRPVVLSPRDRDDPSQVLPGARWKRIGDVYQMTEAPSDPR